MSDFDDSEAVDRILEEDTDELTYFTDVDRYSTETREARRIIITHESELLSQYEELLDETSNWPLESKRGRAIRLFESLYSSMVELDWSVVAESYLDPESETEEVRGHEHEVPKRRNFTPPSEDNFAEWLAQEMRLFYYRKLGNSSEEYEVLESV